MSRPSRLLLLPSVVPSLSLHHADVLAGSFLYCLAGGFVRFARTTTPVRLRSHPCQPTPQVEYQFCSTRRGAAARCCGPRRNAAQPIAHTCPCEHSAAHFVATTGLCPRVCTSAFPCEALLQHPPSVIARIDHTKLITRSPFLPPFTSAVRIAAPRSFLSHRRILNILANALTRPNY